MTQYNAEGVTWDLSDLYDSPESPGICEDLARALSLAVDFREKYQPLLDRSNESGTFPLSGLLKDYKEIVTLAAKPMVYAQLVFAGKTSEPKNGAFLQMVRSAGTQIQTVLLFFEVSWKKLAVPIAERLMDDPAVAADRHFLAALRRWAPYTLSEGEEKILAVKADTGAGAFSRLFDEVVNNIRFFIRTGGKKVGRNESQVLSLLYSRDRSVRQKAAHSLADGLRSNTHLLTYIYNMILADHRMNLKLRGYAHPMEPMNLSNEIETAGVMNLIQCVKASYPVAMRYYRLKKKLLGLPVFYDYDRYAPVGQGEGRIKFERCRDIVLSAYDDFSPEAGRVAELFFSRHWIDAEVRAGKQGGGFSCQTTPDLHPYILVNYTGNVRDVMTVAHEIGHGLHQYLAGRRVGILECDAPLIMAETASVFGEMLVFNGMFEAERDPGRRLALLCGKIDDHFATVYRQIAMTDFELRAHGEGLEKGELASGRLEDLWMEVNREFYGDSVVLSEPYRHGWKYIPHFVHSPFYCYAYAYAQLFVLTLYQKYQEDKEAFVPKYLEMLSLGGSRKPSEIAAMTGLDINAPDFWRAGIGLLDGLVSEAEDLASGVRKNRTGGAATGMPQRGAR